MEGGALVGPGVKEAGVADMESPPTVFGVVDGSGVSRAEEPRLTGSADDGVSS